MDAVNLEDIMNDNPYSPQNSSVMQRNSTTKKQLN